MVNLSNHVPDIKYVILNFNLWLTTSNKPVSLCAESFFTFLLSSFEYLNHIHSLNLHVYDLANLSEVLAAHNQVINFSNQGQRRQPKFEGAKYAIRIYLYGEKL